MLFLTMAGALGSAAKNGVHDSSCFRSKCSIQRNIQLELRMFKSFTDDFNESLQGCVGVKSQSHNSEKLHHFLVFLT